jgi:hypothetical protein
MGLYLLFLLRIFKAFVHSLLYAEAGDIPKPLIFGVGCALLMVGLHGFIEPPMIFEASMVNMMICSALIMSFECRTLKKPGMQWKPRGAIRRYVLPLFVLAGLVVILPRIAFAVTTGRDLHTANTAHLACDYETAERHYRRVAERGWNSAYIQTTVANLSMRRGLVQEAYDTFLDAEALTPYDYKIHLSKGMALMQLDRPDEAVESFDTCLKLSPHFAFAKLMRVNALFKSGRDDEAFAQLETYMRSRVPTREECYEAANKYFIRYDTRPERAREARLMDLRNALRYAEASLRKGGADLYPDLRQRIKYIKHCIHLLEAESAAND